MSDLKLINLRSITDGSDLTLVTYKKDALYYAKTEITYNAKGLQIYPNPNQGKFKIAFQSDYDCEADFEIYSLTGQLKQRIDKVSLIKGLNEQEFDITEMTTGEYNLIIKFSDGQVLQETIIVAK